MKRWTKQALVLAATLAVTGCCARKPPGSITVEHIERRDTSIYRPAVHLDAGFFLPPDSLLFYPVTDTRIDTVAGVSVTLTYTPATREVRALVEKQPDTTLIPRVMERRDTETVTPCPECPDCDRPLWFLSGLAVGLIVGGAGFLLAKLRLL